MVLLYTTIQGKRLKSEGVIECDGGGLEPWVRPWWSRTNVIFLDRDHLKWEWTCSVRADSIKTFVLLTGDGTVL